MAFEGRFLIEYNFPPNMWTVSGLYNIVLRWFLLEHIHWISSFRIWISTFVIKSFPGKGLDWFRKPKVNSDSATDYVTLGSKNLSGLQFFTWEMKNLKWVTTKSPSSFKILLSIWVNICLSVSCSAGLSYTAWFTWEPFKYLRTYDLLGCLFEVKQDRFL